MDIQDWSDWELFRTHTNAIVDIVLDLVATASLFTKRMGSEGNRRQGDINEVG